MAGDVQVQDNAVVPEPDDGFSPEERTQFEAMRAEPTAAPDLAPSDGDAAPAVDADAPVVEAGDKGAVKDGASTAGPGAAAAPSGDADDEGDDDAAGTTTDPAKKPRRVSYSKFEREVTARDKRIADLEKSTRDDAESKARLDERMRIINEALTPKEQAKQEDDDPEPDPETDIFAHNAWLKREMVRSNDRNSAAIKELREGRQQEQAQTQVQRAYEDDAQAFVAREPNFAPAYQFLMANRISELAVYFFGKDMTAEGATLTPQEVNRIRQTIQNEENQLVAGAIKDGKSPAERIFALARARGYRPAAPAANGNGADTAAKTNGNGNGKAAPGNLADAAAATDAKPNGNVKDEIDRVRKGSESGLSLSQGGGAPTMTLTPEKLANMPQAEFDALMDQLSPAQQRVAMGG